MVACIPAEAPSVVVEESDMRLESPVFAEGQPIPRRYTCDGEDVSPPLIISDPPEGTSHFVLIMDDPDAPRGTWDHWVVYDIPGEVGEIPEGTSPGVEGRNSWGRLGYGGPCPPSGTHRYVFRVLALDGPLELGEGATKEQVLSAAAGKILAEATLTGTYRR